MQTLIFKTNLMDRGRVERITPTLNHHPEVLRWCVDLQDIDNVLKIEATDNLNEHHVIHMMERTGFHCEDLPE